MSDWWTQAQSGLIGGIGGGALGVLGGTLGALAGILVPRGKGKTIVLGGMWMGALGGLAALGAGVYALATKQPYHVWYPLLLGGGIGTIVLGSLIPVVRLRYAQAERRRLDAQGIRNT